MYMLYRQRDIMTISKETRKQVAFRLSEGLLNRLKEEARKSDMSLNSFVESILMKIVYRSVISKNEASYPIRKITKK